jgi:hypothetical protein
MIIYLIVKTHNITGLKYLCKTIRKDYEKYTGSGIYWKKHLKIHGKSISTTLIRECMSTQEVKEWGLYYSNLWNIVEERDINGKKTWANMKPEEGDGNSSEYAKNLWDDLEFRKKQSESRKISFNTTEYKERQRTVSKQRWDDPEFRKKRKPQTGVNNSNHDNKIYKFQHESGIIEESTSFDLSEKYNLRPKSVRKLVTNVYIDHKGWRLSENWEKFPGNEWECEICGKIGKKLGNYIQHKSGSKCKPKRN